ncbi:hypothetical protein ACLOJK_017532 [Asimina triloba]
MISRPRPRWTVRRGRDFKASLSATRVKSQVALAIPPFQTCNLERDLGWHLAAILQPDTCHQKPKLFSFPPAQHTPNSRTQDGEALDFNLSTVSISSFAIDRFLLISSPSQSHSILFLCMAYAYPDQRRIFIPGPFVDPRAAIPQPPRAFIPGPLPFINPSFQLPAPPVEFLLQHAAPIYAPIRFALDPAVLIRMEEQRTQSLLQLMVKEGLVPSPEEEAKRRDAITQLKKIVLAWVKKVAWQRRFPKNQIASTGATILTYGSYGLGVHGSESDIDALCVGPIFATMAEDFFIVLRNMLESRLEVSELHCVKNAKVPLMRFKFNGIAIDLPYAQLSVMSVSEAIAEPFCKNVDILNPFFLQNIDETSWRSLSGVRANIRICQLVPNLELLGFFGGIHLAILAANICQRHPDASISALISIFFEAYSRWPWPLPVTLQDGSMPFRDVPEAQSFMPVMMPCSPYNMCNSNITRSTFNKIRTELGRGCSLTKNLGRPDFEWSDLFDPYPYSKRYNRFVKIFLGAPDEEELRDWLGWVKSRFRSLLLKLEEAQGLCDPNPMEYIDHDVTEPNTVFYWGLSPGRSSFTDIDSVKDEFMKSVNNGYQGSGCCRLELSIVSSALLPKNAQFDCGNGYGSKAYWRNPDYIMLGPPVYSHYLPSYFVGYSGPDRYEYAGAGVKSVLFVMEKPATLLLAGFTAWISGWLEVDAMENIGYLFLGPLVGRLIAVLVCWMLLSFWADVCKQCGSVAQAKES